MECTIENFKSLLQQGYSFRFNSLLPADEIYESYFKIATVGYKHRYLLNFMEYGMEEGLEENMKYIREVIDEFISTYRFKK
jgi:hypothetical protein